MSARSLRSALVSSELLPVFQNEGFCPTCCRHVTFSAHDDWWRDSYRCSNCGSIPRERALVATLDLFFPAWPSLTVHESSPVERGASLRLAGECANYTPSQFWPERERGSLWDGVRCEDLERLTFPDDSIDIHVTQDVFEHIFDPKAALREIARTLRSGGAHVFTVPLVRKDQPSRRRAELLADGTVRHLLEAEHHDNPVDAEGSLVTVDWGYDITDHIFEWSGLFTRLVHIDDLSRGIRAELIDVLVTTKPSEATDPALLAG